MKHSDKESASKDLMKVLSSFSEEEKKLAYALLHGMLLGKEFAKQDKSA